MLRVSHLLAICAIGLVSSCGGGSSDSSDPALPSSVTQGPAVLSPVRGGVAVYSVDVDASTSGSQVLAGSASGMLTLLSVKRNGQELLVPPEFAIPIDAQVGRGSPLVFDLPPAGQTLVPGTYVIQVGNSTGSSVTFQTIRKSDPDLASGTVRINMVLAGPVRDALQARDGLESAAGTMTHTLGNGGIDADIAWFDVDGPSELPDPRTGDAFYQVISSNLRPNAINLVFGVNVQNLGQGFEQYFLVPSTPGPALPSTSSAVAFSVSNLAGADGILNKEEDQGFFSSNYRDEIRLTGEEMARAVGHYLGLTDTVMFSGQTVVAADTLDDTPSCITEEDCEHERTARGNFMFPYPLRKHDPRYGNGNDDYHARDYVTDQQSAVMQRSVMVD